MGVYSYQFLGNKITKKHIPVHRKQILTPQLYSVRDLHGFRQYFVRTVVSKYGVISVCPICFHAFVLEMRKFSNQVFLNIFKFLDLFPLKCAKICLNQHFHTSFTDN